MSLFTILPDNVWLTVACCALLGLVVGSFLNVVIYRLPLMMERHWRRESRAFLELPAEADDNTPFNLMVPRSACPHCHQSIAWYDNIPLISWLVLGAKCRHCRKPISIRYPLIELTSALLCGTCAWFFPASFWLLATLVFSWALLTLTMIDFDTTLLPDTITLPLLWAGLLLAAFRISPVSLFDAVLGAVIGYLVLWSIYWLFKLLTGKEGMGFGDFKLLGALGAWLGWQTLPLVILLSSCVGALIGGTLLATGAFQRDQGIPFGPYLATAGWISLLWGAPIMAWWLGV